MHARMTGMHEARTRNTLLENLKLILATAAAATALTMDLEVAAVTTR